jgi:hypothetical protein
MESPSQQTSEDAHDTVPLVQRNRRPVFVAGSILEAPAIVSVPDATGYSGSETNRDHVPDWPRYRRIGSRSTALKTTRTAISRDQIG